MDCGRLKHLDYIDICKAIGIICVILGHTYYGPQVLYNLIYCFHMPLFFILSGYTYDKEKNNELGFLRFVRNKVKRLLIPYIVFAVANLLIQIVWKACYLNETVGLEYIRSNLKGILFCYSSMQHMPNCSPIWFLLCLFIANVVFYFLMKWKDAGTTIAALICLGISYFFSLFPHDYMTYPCKFPVFFMAVFLMYVGYRLRKIADQFDNTRIVAVNIGCLLILLCSIAIELRTENSVGMNENHYGNLIYYLLTALPISSALVILSRNFPVLSGCRPAIWLGRNTIYIVGFNYLCRDIAIEIYYMMPYLKRHEISYTPLFIITLSVCIAFLYIFSTTKNVLYRTWLSMENQ